MKQAKISMHTHTHTPTDCPLFKAPFTHLSYCPIQIQNGALPKQADHLTPVAVKPAYRAIEQATSYCEMATVNLV